MKIIAFTGMPFSGKSEAVRIAKDMNLPVVRMGDMVWDEVKKRDMSLTDENVGKVASEMREKNGKNIWAKRTIDKIKDIPNNKIIVIDGIRNKEEVDTFKKELGQDFILIAIDVNDEIRHKRSLNRGRKDDSLDIEKVKERDRREISWGIKHVIKNADVKIDNNRDMNYFRSEIKDFLNKYLN